MAFHARKPEGHHLTGRPLERFAVTPTSYLSGPSLASKIQGREPVRPNPLDAASRGIAAGDVVLVAVAAAAALPRASG